MVVDCRRQRLPSRVAAGPGINRWLSAFPALWRRRYTKAMSVPPRRYPMRHPVSIISSIHRPWAVVLLILVLAAPLSAQEALTLSRREREHWAWKAPTRP